MSRFLETGFFLLAPFVKEGQSFQHVQRHDFFRQQKTGEKKNKPIVSEADIHFSSIFIRVSGSVWGFLFCFVYFRNYPVLMEKGFFFSVPLFRERIKTLCHPMISSLLKPVNRLLSRFYSESNELFGVHGNNSKGSYLNCGRYWHTTAQ